MDFETVIGLEVHAQMLTDTKIFCSCSTKFGGAPNSHTCPVCLGMPGVLPVLNKKVVEFAMKMALATNCEINKSCELRPEKLFLSRSAQRLSDIAIRLSAGGARPCYSGCKRRAKENRHHQNSHGRRRRQTDA